MIAQGKVTAVREGRCDARMPSLAVGAHVKIGMIRGRVRASSMDSTNVGYDADRLVRPGDAIHEDLHADRVVVGSALLGRCIDSNGESLDGKAPALGRRVRLDSGAPTPADRVGICEPLVTGIRAIDALLTIGRGARIGIFGAPGAGKSTLLETILRGSDADAIVLALVGERGREAQHAIALCDERITVVCETSDRPADARVRAANLAMTHAEALAQRGLHVLFVLDSLARVGYALRELCDDGQPAGRGGYPPSVFANLARLVERAGAFSRGSVTLIATVLSDGDDRDPVSESARALLDGHIQLSPRLANAGHFPAIDILMSSSRTMDGVVPIAHRERAALIRKALASLEASRDLRELGVEPVQDFTRRAVACEERLGSFLRQGCAPAPFDDSLAELREIADILEEQHEHRL